MALPSAIVAATLITLMSIFGIYKLFLSKPSVNIPPASNQEAETSTSPQSPGTLTSGLPANSSPKPSIPNISSSIPTPKPSTEKIIPLQNNTSGNSLTGSSPNAASSAISGTVNLLGTPPSGSSLVIALRPTGSGEQFKVVLDGITAQNNAAWSWNQAQNEVRYDVFAVLKGKSGSTDIDYASSPSSTVKAPYEGQVLVVDIGYALSAPTGVATVSCTTHLSNNSWNTTVNFPAVTGAKMYHVQIGTTSGGNDLLDTTLNAQSVTPNLSDSTNYYFRYSVASVSNPTAYQYSSYSSASTIRCP